MSKNSFTLRRILSYVEESCFETGEFTYDVDDLVVLWLSIKHARGINIYLTIVYDETQLTYPVFYFFYFFIVALDQS